MLWPWQCWDLGFPGVFIDRLAFTLLCLPRRIAPQKMDPKKQESFRGPLQELATEIREDLAANQDDAKTVDLDTSIGRLSRMDAMQSQQMALELRRRQQLQLQRVESALQRIDKGSFGKCGKCHGAISLERLEIQPDAVLCVRCADAR